MCRYYSFFSFFIKIYFRKTGFIILIILHLNGFDDVNETRNKHKYLCMANKLLILYLYADVWLNLLNIIILNQLILSATNVKQN